MTVCPIAVVAGCARCPAVKICPLKGVLGDVQPSKAEKPAGKTNRKAKPKAKASA